MITRARTFLLLISLMILSSCAGPGTGVNPRTMTFPPLKFERPKSERAVLPKSDKVLSAARTVLAY